MKALVVYDSVFGNTEKIAQAIAGGLGSPETLKIAQARDVTPEQLQGLSLLVVGSPTRKFRPTGATIRLLKRIPKDGLKGVRVAAFDTRISRSEIEKVRILAFLVKLFGYAAQPIADRLETKRGQLVVAPEGFYVRGTQGPLVEGELERAAEWARQIMAA
ncbi:flavodoxin family protein [Candidatus Bipolaricaulota bacterium]|nr:flavodoxin family protein [Candidatus Bipolaricaulota bacterium]